MQLIEFKLNEGEFITLKDLLKYTSVASSGAMAKILIKEGEILLNDKPVDVIRKKLYKGDNVRYDDILINIV